MARLTRARMERALTITLTNSADDMRRIFEKAKQQYAGKDDWYQIGTYDGLLAERYAALLAPRLMRTLREDTEA